MFWIIARFSKTKSLFQIENLISIIKIVSFIAGVGNPDYQHISDCEHSQLILNP